jgi:hypothetical protein
MTRYCPTCGAEYIDSVQECADDGSLLQDSPPPSASGAQEDHEILVYELDQWAPEQRTALEVALSGAAIPYQWEGTDLLVPAADEGAVDDLLDTIEFPDALPAEADAEDGGDDIDDEAVYQVMSDLFVIADRIADSNSVDLAVAGDFIEAAAAAAETPPPFGVEARLWQQMQRLAGEIAERLQNEEDDAVVTAEAATLRNALRNFV